VPHLAPGQGAGHRLCQRLCARGLADHPRRLAAGERGLAQCWFKCPLELEHGNHETAARAGSRRADIAHSRNVSTVYYMQPDHERGGRCNRLASPALLSATTCCRTSSLARVAQDNSSGMARRAFDRGQDIASAERFEWRDTLVFSGAGSCVAAASVGASIAAANGGVRSVKFHIRLRFPDRRSAPCGATP